jgi:hypothetical protein
MTLILGLCELQNLSRWASQFGLKTRKICKSILVQHLWATRFGLLKVRNTPPYHARFGPFCATRINSFSFSFFPALYHGCFVIPWNINILTIFFYNYDCYFYIFFILLDILSFCSFIFSHNFFIFIFIFFIFLSSCSFSFPYHPSFINFHNFLTTIYTLICNLVFVLLSFFSFKMKAKS